MKLERSPQMLFYHYDLDQLVDPKHELREVARIVDFSKIAKKHMELKATVGRNGYGVDVGIKALFLQFYYDLSDRELETRLRHDLAFRWFCKIELEDQTPDHSFFSRIRKKLGTKRIGQVFKNIVQKSEDAGIIRKVFTFVDSTAIKSKETTWTDRDKAIKAGEEKLNNRNIEKYAADREARFGMKGRGKHWYGYKEHIGADMGSGMIKKIAVTSADVMDEHGFKHVCPDGGMVFGDKSYCVEVVQREMQRRGCHSGAIMKKNMKLKNYDKDKWLCKVRGPYENIFSKMKKRAIYRGLAKMQMQAFMSAIVFNVKRLIKLKSPPLMVGA